MDSWEYIVKTDKKNIDYINKVFEAFEGIANVRTLDPKEGLIKLLTNEFFLSDVDSIIKSLINYDVNIEIIDKRKWLGIL